MKTTERKVPYVCRDCGHTQHQTEIVMPDGTFYVGGSANWCEMCGNGLPVRQVPAPKTHCWDGDIERETRIAHGMPLEATPADLEVYDATALGLSKPEHIGEVVVGENGFTKGWTVVRWREDLPPIPVGTKLYTTPQVMMPPLTADQVYASEEIMAANGLHAGLPMHKLMPLVQAIEKVLKAGVVP